VYIIPFHLKILNYIATYSLPGKREVVASREELRGVIFWEEKL
jgi:hypothetical protein